jgi:hypothetical protein
VCLVVEISITDREHGHRPSLIHPVVSSGFQLTLISSFKVELYSSTLILFLPISVCSAHAVSFPVAVLVVPLQHSFRLNNKWPSMCDNNHLLPVKSSMEFACCTP